jgi:bacillithiol biosynthesis deacetylase BshB1
MTVDALAVGAHPDDVELSIGGTLAKLTGTGRSVAILDLTRGEMGSRGTPEIRAEEARKAGEVLGISERITLDQGDALLQNTLENRKQVIEVIRQLRPKIVFAQYWDDLHPDHAASGQIVRSVMYPAGFAKYPAEGDPYRPNEFLFFMAHSTFQPSLVIDVSDCHDKKLEAIRCFKSQLDPSEDGPRTSISQPEFIPRLEGRAKYFGSMIDRPYGEAFLTTRPVPMVDPVEHYEPFPKLH